MDQVTVNDTAQRFVEKINDNFEEAGIASSLSYASAAGDFVDALNAKFGQPTSPVSTGDTGLDFVQHINTSFANLSPGDPGETGTILMDMQAGELDRGYSVEYGGKFTDALNVMPSIETGLWNYCHSAKLLDIGSCTVKSVATRSGETLTIHWFKSDRSQGGTCSIGSIPSNARYLRFQLSSSSPIASDRKLSVTVEGTAYLRYNAAKRASDNRTYITYEVRKHEEFSTGYDYFGNDRIYDNGFILLPSGDYGSYSPDTPVNLAVFIQGTGGYPFNRNGYNLCYYSQYSDVLNFIANTGMAVCCCSGITSKYVAIQYSYVGRQLNNMMFGPSFCESVASMVDYIKANYNIGKVYIYGKSSGGMLCNYAPLVDYVGAECAASLAPAICPIVSKVYRQTYNAVCTNAIARQLGIDHTFTQSGWSSDDIAAVTDYIDRWRKFDSFFASYNTLTDVNVKDIATDAFGSSKQSIAVVMDEKQRTKDLINSNKRSFPVPHRIWCAKDDTAVDYNACAVLCDRTDGYSLVTLADGIGHNADMASNAEKENYTLPNGTVLESTKAYVEMVKWFNCDGNPSNSN